jgi:protein TonB
MFNNLIESSSNRKELKRRGSFFLVTTATYGLMLVLTGIASIYAYDARLDDQIYEQVITMLPPEQVITPERVIADGSRRPNPGNRSSIPERTTAMAPVDRPEIQPDKISTEPNKVLPLPQGPVRITDRDWDPPMPSGGNGPVGPTGSHVVPPARIVIADDPPPPPPQPKIVRTSTVLNSKALSLPKPAYPPLAKQIGQHGTVTVQVLIDETGRVISAQAIGGPPLLIAEAKKAALQARFSPTIIGEQPVKVSGVITYNFVLQ